MNAASKIVPLAVRRLFPAITAVACSTLLAGPAAAGAAVKGCPTAALVSSVAGASLAKIQDSGSGGSDICFYKGGKFILDITTSPTPSLTAATFKTAMRKLANKDHAKGFKTLSGLGSEALGWQFKDNGQTTIALAVFADNSELVEISTLPEKTVVAIAKKVLG